MTSAELARWLVEPDAARLVQVLDALAAETGAAKALRGELARRQRDFATAIPLLDAAADALPDVRPLQHAAALAHAASGDRAGARARWTALLAHSPGDAVVRYQIASTFEDDGDLAQAVHWYEAQVAHNAAMPAAWLNLGRVRASLGDAEGAMLAWDRAHALAPDDPRPLRLSAALAGERADLPEAIERFTRAIALMPGDAGLRFARAAHASSLALHAQAVTDLEAAVALAPDDAAGHSALLLELHYDEALASVDAMRTRHDAWNARHGRDTVPSIRRPRPRPRLRIGFLSPRFGDAPLDALLVPVLEAHDRSRFELFAYASHPVPEAAAIRTAVDAWRDLPRDDELATQRIAADECDLLVDLAGHAPGNRLPLLARKPAARQATWLDYFDTTGVPAIDFLIGDAWHTPVAHAGRYRERLVLMPEARFAYRPPAAVTPPPSRQGGRGVAFGSFNRLAKIGDDVVGTWTAILRAMPDATLTLRASAFRSPQTIAHVRERWRALGLPVERVSFVPFVSITDLHASYAGIDIALDTFPFNGGVTTCDALAHGIPVVTLAGERMVSRQGLALLNAARRPNWVAGSRDDYVAIAVSLARNIGADDPRRGLQASIRNAPLFDVDGFAHALERAYVAMIGANPGRAPIVVS